jgi:hypothetical protein
MAQETLTGPTSILSGKKYRKSPRHRMRLKFYMIGASRSASASYRLEDRKGSSILGRQIGQRLDRLYLERVRCFNYEPWAIEAA